MSLVGNLVALIGLALFLVAFWVYAIRAKARWMQAIAIVLLLLVLLFALALYLASGLPPVIRRA